jgi:RNA 3'-terminal phosphate cyclase (ATP)
MAEFVELDGSLGEGGGQILRSSMTLSLLTGKPFRLHNIRAGRPKPGLRPQHLMSIRAAATIGHAQALGEGSADLLSDKDQWISLRNSELSFMPGEVEAGSYRFDIGTAGSTSLVLQTILLPLALRGRAPSDVIFTGGTHVTASPCFDFLQKTWVGYHRLFGLSMILSMRRAGFYPRGGGEVHAHVEPITRIEAAQIPESSNVTAPVTGFAAVAQLEESIARRMVRKAASQLKRAKIPSDLSVQHWPGGPGTGIVLVFSGGIVPTLFFGLGELHKRAEKVATEAVNELLAHIATGAPVDPHSADQILLPLVFADGPSIYYTSRVTQHLLTNIQVVRQFVPREVRCEGQEGSPGRVIIENR